VRIKVIYETVGIDVELGGGVIVGVWCVRREAKEGAAEAEEGGGDRAGEDEPESVGLEVSDIVARDDFWKTLVNKLDMQKEETHIGSQGPLTICSKSMDMSQIRVVYVCICSMGGIRYQFIYNLPAMPLRTKRNFKALQLPTGPTLNQPPAAPRRLQSLPDSSHRSAIRATITQTIAGFPHRKNLELEDEKLDHLREIGQGNGGTVSLVRHRDTDIIMAKKVGYSLSHLHPSQSLTRSC